MTKKLNKTEEKIETFSIGDKIIFYSYDNDGRSGYSDTLYGIVSKVNRKTLEVTTKIGDLYRVDKKEVEKIDNLF